MYYVIGSKQAHDMKNVTLKTAKKNRGCRRSTGKSNTILVARAVVTRRIIRLDR